MKLVVQGICVLIALTSSVWAQGILHDAAFDLPEAFLYTDTYNGAESAWLTDGEWSKSLDDDLDGTYYAEAGDERSQLYQVVNYVGSPGTIDISLYYQKNPSGFQLYIYGSDVKPLTGSSWDSDTWINYECPFGERLWSMSPSGAAFDDWILKEDTDYNDKGYNWYTVRIQGNLNGGSNTGYDEAKAENVFITVPSVPEPGVCALFAMGAVALIRRRRG